MTVLLVSLVPDGNFIVAFLITRKGATLSQLLALQTNPPFSHWKLQDGVLKNKETYEIMDAELVGLHQDTSLVLGKHSGRHAFRSRLQVNPCG